MTTAAQAVGAHAELEPSASETSAAMQVQADHRRSNIQGAALAAGIFLVSRVFVLCAISLGTVVRPGLSIRDALQHWDAAWYLKAATTGYPDHVVEHAGRAVQSTIAFFPLFPFLVRVVHDTTGLSPIAAGVLVATVSGAAASSLIWMLTREISGEAVANRATVLFALFPSSFALFMPFAEGITIALSAACLLALLRGRWAVAGLCAAGATAARPSAVVLVAACGWAAVAAVLARREWRALLAPALAPLGIVAYFGYLWWRVGDAMAWFRVEEEGWGQQTDWGRTTFRALRDTFDRSPLSDFNATAATAALLFAIAGAACLARWRPPAVLVVYVAGITFLSLTAGVASRPRYMLAAFPFVMGIAATATREVTFGMVAGGFATLLGAYAIVSTATEWAIF